MLPSSFFKKLAISVAAIVQLAGLAAPATSLAALRPGCSYGPICLQYICDPAMYGCQGEPGFTSFCGEICPSDRPTAVACTAVAVEENGPPPYDCNNPIICCYAETPSCIACREEAQAQAAWCAANGEGGGVGGACGGSGLSGLSGLSGVPTPPPTGVPTPTPTSTTTPTIRPTGLPTPTIPPPTGLPTPTPSIPPTGLPTPTPTGLPTPTPTGTNGGVGTSGLTGTAGTPTPTPTGTNGGIGTSGLNGSSGTPTPTPTATLTINPTPTPAICSEVKRNGFYNGTRVVGRPTSFSTKS